MNRSAYFTTEIAIKTLSKLLKAKTIFHGLDNIPDGPIIFVINHFTRIETFLLPYYLYHLTKTPIWSLADDGLFKGGLKSYFDMVGVVSTKDPQRDKLIVKTLLTGEAHWIIFPEGRMVKTKKLVRKGSYVIGDDHTARSPHTGAASLALRAEIFRRFLLRDGVETTSESAELREFLGIEAEDVLDDSSVKIVPINLTYYPIRAQDNILSEFAARYVKEPSERILEELMTEGTMLLDGVDIDIHFGRPLEVAEEMNHPIMNQVLDGPAVQDFDVRPEVLRFLQKTATRMMHTYMGRIYSSTTINHDHLFASFLRKKSFRPFHGDALARSVFLASEYLLEYPGIEKNLHLSLRENQLHLLVDDRYKKQESFINLALETACLLREGPLLKKNQPCWNQPLLFHRARIENPTEVMANEVEPLPVLQKYIRWIARMPDWLLRLVIARRLYLKERERYRDELSADIQPAKPNILSGQPFLLPSRSLKTGVVLVHSYLSVPREMRELAQLLRRHGCWVYGVRLPGHGSSPETLATITWEDWRETVERGYALINSICRNVFLVGFSAGGSLVMELASRLDSLTGVVAVCPPLVLQDYSKRFMPATHVWNRLLSRWKGNQMSEEFVEFEPENPEINFHRNPVAGVNEVGKLLEACKERLPHLRHPILTISADRDQVIGHQSGREVYDLLGSRHKEMVTISSERHNIIYGPDAGRVRELIAAFIRDRLGNHG